MNPAIAPKPIGESRIHEEIGIDVSKAFLDVFHNGSQDRIPNCAPEIRRWLRVAAANGPVRVSAEATGCYTRELVGACLDLGIPISLLNPRNVRSFAKAKGQLAKTDKIDARLVAEYASAFDPPALDKGWPARDELRQLHCRLQQLIASRAKCRTSLEQYHSKSIRAEVKREIAALSKRIETYRSTIDELIRSSQLQERREIMESIIGIGAATSTTLLIHLPELGRLNRKEAAALAGLAPMNRDSGAGRGKRTIQAGRGEPRKALYMAALTAAHRNPDFMSFYSRLRDQGKPVKVCLIAVARKLLIQINSNLKNLPQKPLTNT